MNDHTLEPWVIDDTRMCLGRTIIREKSDGAMVCHVDEPFGLLWGEIRAKTRLIAAAPKLLEACKLLVERLQGTMAVSAYEAIGQGGMLPALYAEAVAAIESTERESYEAEIQRTAPSWLIEYIRTWREPAK